MSKVLCVFSNDIYLSTNPLQQTAVELALPSLAVLPVGTLVQ